MKTKRKKFEALAPDAFDAELDASVNKRTKVRRLPTEYLTPEDRLHIRFDRGGRRMVGFAIQYDCLIDGNWHRVIAVDASRLERPHQHVYHPNPRKNRKDVLVGMGGNYATIFHAMMRTLRERFEDYKANYRTLYEQGRNR